MNIKEDNIQKAQKTCQYDLKLKRKVEKLILESDNQISERKAIQRLQENYRTATGKRKLGQVFTGNSNKYYFYNCLSYIQNRVQKRNNLKKDYSLFM